MKRTDADHHVGNLFQTGNPLTGQRGTRLDHTWLNAVQEELVSVIEAAGLPLDPDDDSQLSQAIRKITLPSFDTLADATNGTAFLPGDVDVVYVKSHTADGTGGAYYRRTAGEPGQIGQFQDTANRSWKLNEFFVLPEMFGAAADGITDDTRALQAAVDFCVTEKAKLLLAPQAHYRVSNTIRVTGPIQFDGQLAQVYQQTPNIDLFHFDRGARGTANFQYTYDIRNIMGATAAGTGDAFVFRNILEASIANLYCPGVGNAAFRISGCLLTRFEHLYSGSGLKQTPGFFVTSLPVNRYGFYLEGLNGLGCNSNTFDRCTATNSTVTAFHIEGSVNVFIAADSEGIHAPAKHAQISGFGTTFIGGNFEGNGGGLVVDTNNCSFIGLNCLSFVNVRPGTTGTTIDGGNIRYVNLVAGCSNNTVRNVRISAGGALINNGTDNEVVNVRDPAGNEIGHNRSGTFAPVLRYGGAASVSAYSTQQGRWYRDGRIVHFTLSLQPGGSGSQSGNATIDLNDLPFKPAASGLDTPCQFWGNGIAGGAGHSPVTPVLIAGTKTIALRKMIDTNGYSADVRGTDILPGSQLQISGWFAL